MHRGGYLFILCLMIVSLLIVLCIIYVAYLMVVYLLCNDNISISTDSTYLLYGIVVHL